MDVVVAAVVGVVSHKLFWSRYELDAHVWRLTLATLCFLVLPSLVPSSSVLRTSTSAGILCLVYYLSVFSSIAVYRVWFHPLSKYPGPSWARLWVWWKIKATAKRGPHYKLIKELHDRYGDVVRVGPNHLSINNIEALNAIYGSQSQCTKPASYLIGGLVSVQSERDPGRHKVRRTVWDKALGTQACNSFTPRLNQSANLLVHRIREHESKPLNVNDWMHFITFDVMAELVFSRSWGQLLTGKLNEGVAFATQYLKYAIYGSQVPWLSLALMQIPGLPEPQSQMMAFASKALDERARHEPQVPDAMSYLLRNKDPEAQQFLTQHDLQSDSFMIQLAGADTSFSVLINVLVHLAIDPNLQDRLREELRLLPPARSDVDKNADFSWPALSSAPLLDAIVREALRMHPPVPSGQPRLTPAAGLTVPTLLTTDSDDTLHVPGNAIVSVPTYTVHHDARNWVNPSTFDPSRWLERAELIKDRRAFCPFSLGTYGCAGKYFAYMEIKIIIAKIVSAFEVRVSKEEMLQQEWQEEWFREQQDWMTLQPAEVELSFVEI